MEADQAIQTQKGSYIKYQHVSSAVLLTKEENVEYLAQLSGTACLSFLDGEHGMIQ